MHTGLPLRRALTRLLGRRKDTVSSFLPSETSVIAQALGLSREEVLWKHTVFPYVTAFMTPEQTRLHALKLMQDCDDVTPAPAALIQSATLGRPKLRFCRLCVGQDIRRYGESYWHRVHCLPGVLLCPEHRCPLSTVDVPLNASGRAANTPLPQRQHAALERLLAPASLALALAKASSQALGSTFDRHDRWRTQLRARALRCGYVLASGQVATARLSAELRAAYGQEFLASVGCDYTNFPLAWPALLVRESVREPSSPLRHLLLTTFLEHKPNAVGLASFTPKPPGKRPRDKGALDRFLADSVSHQLERIRGSGERVTAQQLIEKAGLWNAWRHDRRAFPLTAKEIALFRRTEVSLRKLGRRDGRRYSKTCEPPATLPSP